MARWGEGDPRWLVQDRPDDGVNINGWHWEERDRLAWARDRVPAVLVAATLADGGLKITTATITDGDCWVAVRKAGRVCCHFDLVLKVGWETEGGASGEACVREFAPDSTAEDLHVESGADGVEGQLRAALAGAVDAFRAELEATLDG